MIRDISKDTFWITRPGDEKEPPHYMKPDADCMGLPTSAYWRQFLFCKDGTCVCGCGESPELASQEANKNRNERESYINQDAADIIRELTSNENSCRGTREQNDFNKAVARFLKIIP